MTLKIENLHVKVEDKQIIKGISLEIKPGEVHVLMGPNGAGKSTLLNALMGHPKYQITDGKIILDNKDITSLSADLKSKEGLFLSFQQPLEFPGIRLSHYLRTIVNSNKDKKIGVPEFQKILTKKSEELSLDPSFIRRNLNENFSGGEKKRAEILQLSLLEPKYALLDETDSGLDVDAIKKVSQTILNLKKENDL